MELRPVRENKDILYPTAKEVKKCNSSKNINILGKVLFGGGNVFYAIAPISYMPDIEEIESYTQNSPILTIKNILVLVSLLFTALLIVNSIMINRIKNEEKIHKLKKHRKIILIGLLIEVLIIALITITK